MSPDTRNSTYLLEVSSPKPRVKPALAASIAAALWLLGGCVAVESSKPVVNPYAPSAAPKPVYDLREVPDLGDPETLRGYVGHVALTLDRSAKQLAFLASENSELKERLDQTQTRIRELEESVGALLAEKRSSEDASMVEEASTAGDEPSPEASESSAASGPSDRDEAGKNQSRELPKEASKDVSKGKAKEAATPDGAKSRGDGDRGSGGRSGGAKTPTAGGGDEAAGKAADKKAPNASDAVKDRYDDPRSLNRAVRKLRKEGRHEDVLKLVAKHEDAVSRGRDKYSVNTEYVAIDSHYKLRNCELVASRATRFLRAHPFSPEAPYAHIRLAICQAALKQNDMAKATLRKIMSLYPDTKAAKEAARLLEVY